MFTYHQSDLIDENVDNNIVNPSNNMTKTSTQDTILDLNRSHFYQRLQSTYTNVLPRPPIQSVHYFSSYLLPLLARLSQLYDGESLQLDLEHPMHHQQLTPWSIIPTSLQSTPVNDTVFSHLISQLLIKDPSSALYARLRGDSGQFWHLVFNRTHPLLPLVEPSLSILSHEQFTAAITSTSTSTPGNSLISDKQNQPIGGLAFPQLNYYSPKHQHYVQLMQLLYAGLYPHATPKGLNPSGGELRTMENIPSASHATGIRPPNHSHSIDVRMVISGPGSGKTATVAAKAAWLLSPCSPKDLKPATTPPIASATVHHSIFSFRSPIAEKTCGILTLTFTRAAAASLRERIFLSLCSLLYSLYYRNGGMINLDYSKSIRFYTDYHQYYETLRKTQSSPSSRDYFNEQNPQNVVTISSQLTPKTPDHSGHSSTKSSLLTQHGATTVDLSQNSYFTQVICSQISSKQRSGKPHSRNPYTTPQKATQRGRGGAKRRRSQQTLTPINDPFGRNHDGMLGMDDTDDDDGDGDGDGEPLERQYTLQEQELYELALSYLRNIKICTLHSLAFQVIRQHFSFTRTRFSILPSAFHTMVVCLASYIQWKYQQFDAYRQYYSLLYLASDAISYRQRNQQIQSQDDSQFQKYCEHVHLVNQSLLFHNISIFHDVFLHHQQFRYIFDHQSIPPILYTTPLDHHPLSEHLNRLYDQLSQNGELTTGSLLSPLPDQSLNTHHNSITESAYVLKTPTVFTPTFSSLQKHLQQPRNDEDLLAMKQQELFERRLKQQTTSSQFMKGLLRMVELSIDYHEDTIDIHTDHQSLYETLVSPSQHVPREITLSLLQSDALLQSNDDSMQSHKTMSTQWPFLTAKKSTLPFQLQDDVDIDELESVNIYLGDDLDLHDADDDNTNDGDISQAQIRRNLIPKVPKYNHNYSASKSTIQIKSAKQYNYSSRANLSHDMLPPGIPSSSNSVPHRAPIQSLSGVDLNQSTSRQPGHPHNPSQTEPHCHIKSLNELPEFSEFDLHKTQEFCTLTRSIASGRPNFEVKKAKPAPKLRRWQADTSVAIPSYLDASEGEWNYLLRVAAKCLKFMEVMKLSDRYFDLFPWCSPTTLLKDSFKGITSPSTQGTLSGGASASDPQHPSFYSDSNTHSNGNADLSPSMHHHEKKYGCPKTHLDVVFSMFNKYCSTSNQFTMNDLIPTANILIQYANISSKISGGQASDVPAATATVAFSTTAQKTNQATSSLPSPGTSLLAKYDSYYTSPAYIHSVQALCNPKHIIVDEAQDLCQSQWEMVVALASHQHGESCSPSCTSDPHHSPSSNSSHHTGEGQASSHLSRSSLQLSGPLSLTLVGDDDQSIYGFRGATGTIFTDCSTCFPHAKIHTLTTNHRSQKPIVSLCNLFIKRNKLRIDKTIVSGVPSLKDDSSTAPPPDIHSSNPSCSENEKEPSETPTPQTATDNIYSRRPRADMNPLSLQHDTSSSSNSSKTSNDVPQKQQESSIRPLTLLPRVELFECKMGTEEIFEVLKRIRQLQSQGVTSIAILSRTNDVVNAFTKVFKDHGMAVTTASTQKRIEKAKSKDELVISQKQSSERRQHASQLRQSSLKRRQRHSLTPNLIPTPSKPPQYPHDRRPIQPIAFQLSSQSPCHRGLVGTSQANTSESSKELVSTISSSSFSSLLKPHGSRHASDPANLPQNLLSLGGTSSLTDSHIQRHPVPSDVDALSNTVSFGNEDDKTQEIDSFSSISELIAFQDYVNNALNSYASNPLASRPLADILQTPSIPQKKHDSAKEHHTPSMTSPILLTPPPISPLPEPSHFISILTQKINPLLPLIPSSRSHAVNSLSLSGTTPQSASLAMTIYSFLIHTIAWVGVTSDAGDTLADCFCVLSIDQTYLTLFSDATLKAFVEIHSAVSQIEKVQQPPSGASTAAGSSSLTQFGATQSTFTQTQSSRNPTGRASNASTLSISPINPDPDVSLYSINNIRTRVYKATLKELLRVLKTLRGYCKQVDQSSAPMVSRVTDDAILKELRMYERDMYPSDRNPSAHEKPSAWLAIHDIGELITHQYTQIQTVLKFIIKTVFTPYHEYIHSSFPSNGDNSQLLEMALDSIKSTIYSFLEPAITHTLEPIKAHLQRGHAFQHSKRQYPRVAASGDLYITSNHFLTLFKMRWMLVGVFTLLRHLLDANQTLLSYNFQPLSTFRAAVNTDLPSDNLSQGRNIIPFIEPIRAVVGLDGLCEVSHPLHSAMNLIHQRLTTAPPQEVVPLPSELSQSQTEEHPRGERLRITFHHQGKDPLHAGKQPADNVDLQTYDYPVCITTIHNAKGLEFDTVFVVRCNRSTFPLFHEPCQPASIASYQRLNALVDASITAVPSPRIFVKPDQQKAEISVKVEGKDLDSDALQPIISSSTGSDTHPPLQKQGEKRTTLYSRKTTVQSTSQSVPSLDTQSVNAVVIPKAHPHRQHTHCHPTAEDDNDDPSEMLSCKLCEEEARIFYVGLSRAQNKLILTMSKYAEKKDKSGLITLAPSPYIESLVHVSKSIKSEDSSS